ncbi:hypothetical protein COCSUDRAFT_32247 [Coccomyxa subellipsoidea C-169]|uniref:Uncharacterized protein n=1 Tax=Coccomyxa subellipsoidea (strain C-169) TaxID=574566 RepID=I0Z7T3_COCSC|nr:hypothetical protein COCSUDRAFT_32247 [Coccomyxa subellipsoidea C-169]EIE26702.1 hypothetical protein COCSUDRAFT_32247 [Coccomyxa subellipsoidea C-169]|eukprot:XP_005651246.1 hypothetical protein COCSUDRAFT_32247 [Coccomyxa subellipsoidea C-169]
MVQMELVLLGSSCQRIYAARVNDESAVAAQVTMLSIARSCTFVGMNCRVSTTHPGAKTTYCGELNGVNEMVPTSHALTRAPARVPKISTSAPGQKPWVSFRDCEP